MSMNASDRIGGREPLHRALGERLREHIRSGSWRPGDRIPTEGQLVEQYGLSRATVRQALSILEHEGWITTRHGAGRYVAPPREVVSTGLEELKSITTTIAEQGHVPGMVYRLQERRPASERESTLLELEPEAPVLALEREITADGEIVAFSYDVLPVALVGTEQPSASVFAFLEERGIVVRSGFASVHAVQDPEIGWGLGDANPMYIMLDQVHRSGAGAVVMYSRTYFVEGSFHLTVARNR